MLDRIGHWSEYLMLDEGAENLKTIQQHAKTGRPVGSEAFIEGLEVLTGKSLKKGKPGPKPGIK